MADATDTLRRAMALLLPAPRSAMLAYDADPFAAQQGRTPLRCGYPLDMSKARFVPGPAPSQPRKAPTMATDTTTTTPDAELVSKLIDYLETCLSPEQMEDVRTILAGGDVQTPEVAAAMDRARGMGAAEEGFLKRFPLSGRFVR